MWKCPVKFCCSGRKSKEKSPETSVVSHFLQNHLALGEPSGCPAKLRGLDSGEGAGRGGRWLARGCHGTGRARAVTLGGEGQAAWGQLIEVEQGPRLFQDLPCPGGHVQV